MCSLECACVEALSNWYRMGFDINLPPFFRLANGYLWKKTPRFFRLVCETFDAAFGLDIILFHITIYLVRERIEFSDARQIRLWQSVLKNCSILGRPADLPFGILSLLRSDWKN